jgi:hypothetical protein
MSNLTINPTIDPRTDAPITRDPLEDAPAFIAKDPTINTPVRRARQVSHELREGSGDPDLARRRWIVGLSLLGAAAGQAVTAYQMGLIKTLPDPPIPVFDSPKVDAAENGYWRFESPDAPAMIASYGVTAALASAGGTDRAETHPWLPIATAAKALGDVVTTVKLGAEEWQVNKKLCFYCQVATVASLATAVLAVPEALRALGNLKKH